MSKTTNKFAPEVRVRAIGMVLDHEGDYLSRWAAITSVAEKIGCSGQTMPVEGRHPPHQFNLENSPVGRRSQLVS